MTEPRKESPIVKFTFALLVAISFYAIRLTLYMMDEGLFTNEWLDDIIVSIVTGFVIVYGVDWIIARTISKHKR